ncbi:hypothetical protein BVC80_1769g51 [Macleaya cordata]|uniref:Uncharacterized protein n=1 Tax=Macleaya cordata TaxID=56857 RepID=A0A200QTL6_MACCD|nr:hypothetical protein BVC80_1769g51 [Macleaya cordata]
MFSIVPRSSGSSSSGGSEDYSKASDKTKAFQEEKLRCAALDASAVAKTSVGLKSGLKFTVVDQLQAGNVVKLVLVLGLAAGWGIYIHL